MTHGNTTARARTPTHVYMNVHNFDAYCPPVRDVPAFHVGYPSGVIAGYGFTVRYCTIVHCDSAAGPTTTSFPARDCDR